MKKTSKIYFVIGVIFIVCIICMPLIKNKGNVYVVKSDGKVIRTIDVDSVTEPYSFDVENNGVNTITVEKGKISVTDSDCPDRICMRQSESGVFPVVCLPHKLVIERKGAV